MRRLALLFVLVLGCHYDPAPGTPGAIPPLPPSSGTPVGYLLDAATDLKLRDDQLGKIKEIDASLAARDAEIDTQLRQVEKPDEEEAAQAKAEHRHHNNAPGVGIKSSADAGKLHDARNRNDKEALAAAFAILDPDQQTAARKLLEDRGVQAPGSQMKKDDHPTEEGTPLPGGEP